MSVALKWIFMGAVAPIFFVAIINTSIANARDVDEAGTVVPGVIVRAKSRTEHRHKQRQATHVADADLETALRVSQQAAGVSIDRSVRGETQVTVRGFDQLAQSTNFEGIDLEGSYANRYGIGDIPLTWIGKLSVDKVASDSRDDVAQGGNVRAMAPLFDRHFMRLRIGLASNRFDAGQVLDFDHWKLYLQQGFYHRRGLVAAKWSRQLREETRTFETNEDLARDYIGKDIDRKGIMPTARNRLYYPPIYLNTDEKSVDMLVRAHAQWAAHQLKLTAGYVIKEKGLGLGDAYMNRFWRMKPWHRLVAGANWHVETTQFFSELSLSLLHHRDRLERYANALLDEVTQYSDIVDTATSLQWQLGWMPFLAYDLTLTAVFKGQFERRDFPLHKKGEVSLDVDRPAAQRGRWRAQLGVDYAFSDMQWETFAKVAYLGSVDSMQQAHDSSALHDVNAAAGLRYHPLHFLSLSLQVSRRLRMPTLKEFNTRMPDRLNDKVLPTLKPQRGWHIDLGAGFSLFDLLKLEIKGYDWELWDVIEQNGIYGAYTAVNIDRVRSAGLESTLALSDFYGLDASVGYDYAYTENLTTHKPLSNVSAHRLRLHLAYSPLKQLLLETNVRYESSRPAQARDAQRSITLGAFWLVGAGILWRYNNDIEMSLTGENLLNTAAQQRYGVPMEGRRFFLQCRVQL